MYRFVRALRQAPVERPLPAPGIADRVSVQQAIWLLVRPSEHLKADEQSDLEALCQASLDLAA